MRNDLFISMTKDNMLTEWEKAQINNNTSAIVHQIIAVLSDL